MVGEKLQEQATEIGERYDELWNEKAEEGLLEGGVSECDEEQVIRDERMRRMFGWRKGILRTLGWLRDTEGVEWGEWDESLKVEFINIVKKC